ncbi:phosphotransferase family protein [Proteiniclasticum ruminis]|uniref:Phosphotransferase enzyme family protein n=1 Tax=Proteiniclasticum ruminis TaxID=398199 RepID=A0A1I5B4N4_9CLOT|nr:aminoglycoside phosphotransferase family protein [Proteiniclasticum ruminis]SFN69665.1 Phosphotransferase enzyme family protein [Proteiniclasticum ruminis]
MIGKKIGEGRTAEVYDWSEDTVIKLFNDFVSAEEADREYQMQKLLCEHLPFCAGIYGREMVEGRSGLIYEKVQGSSMTKLLSSSPEKSRDMGKLMAEIHHKIHAVGLKSLPSIKEGTKHALSHAEKLSDDMKRKLLEILSELPEKESLCHMDFHPDNIFLDEERIVVLDWMTAGSGDPLADVARTEMILKFAVFPDVVVEIKDALQLLRGELLSGYHAVYFTGGITPEEERNLYLWETVLLGARLREGISDEECGILLDEIHHRLEDI